MCRWPTKTLSAWLRLADLSREAVSPLAPNRACASAVDELPHRADLRPRERRCGDLDHEALLGATTGTVGLGIFFGLVVGKPLGVWAASTITVRTGIAVLPRGVSRPHSC